MSEINRSVYPARPVTLTGLEITQPTLADERYYPNNATWDTSICISQSTAELAPFNTTAFYVPWGTLSLPELVTKKKAVQKIGLYYTQELNTFGSRSQQPSGRFPAGQIFDYALYRLAYGRRPYVGGVYVDGLRPQNYYFVTGLDFQCALCVICVRFTNNTYCSLAYYNAHKNDTLSNYTPSSLFMLGLFGGDNTTSRQSFAPFDCEPYEFIQWARNENDEITMNDTPQGACSTKYPYCVMRGISALSQADFSDSRNVNALNDYCLIFPLVGCMSGSYTVNPQVMSDYWKSAPRQTYGSLLIVGGVANTHYTMQIIDNTRITTVLTQQAFDDVREIAATYGLPFADDFPVGGLPYLVRYNDFYSDETITTYIPIANGGGYYNGRFEVLTRNGEVSTELTEKNAELWNGGINAPYNGRAYDPDIPIPAEEIDLTEPSFTPIGAFNKTYILNKDGVDGIQDFIYGADDSVIQNLLDGLKTFGANPMNAFLSLHMYPFEVREFTGAATTARVVCGRVPISPQSGDVIGYLLPTNAKAVVDLGNFKIDPMFDCFLDFEPYTTIQLYIPFIGSVDLPPSLFMNKRVHVKIVCDWITAAATAIVYADGIPLIYQSGIIGVSIAMTGDNHAKTASDVLSGIVGAAGSAAQAVSGAMSLNPVQTATGAADTLKNLLSAQAAYTKTEFMQAGAASPMCALYLPNKCYITISRPRIGISEVERPQYNIINGFSMNRTATINSLISGGELAGGTGFIQAAPSVIPMKQYLGGITDGEYEELIQILTHGFRIDPL